MSTTLSTKLSWAFRFTVTIWLLAASASVPTFAETATPVLVELFTSEGCSDCPPADTLLRTLDATQPIPGAQLVVLEEHVDYWDDQGWRDPFSSHLLTLRQTEYVDQLHSHNGPYTPQMVVDGSDEFVGSDRVRAQQAFKNALTTQKTRIEISQIKAENGKVFAHIATGPVPSKAEVYIALALDHAQSQVARGENGGRNLQHVAVVKSLLRVGKIGQGESFSSDVAVPAQSTGESYRVIAFVQEPNQGRVLGAAQERISK